MRILGYMKNTNRPEFIPAYAFDSYDWAADADAEDDGYDPDQAAAECAAELANERYFETLPISWKF
jgi:hypothetical protein